MRAKDCIGRSVLAIAASSGDKVTFKAVLRKIEMMEVSHYLYLTYQITNIIHYLLVLETS